MLTDGEHENLIRKICWSKLQQAIKQIEYRANANGDCINRKKVASKVNLKTWGRGQARKSNGKTTNTRNAI